MKNERKAVGALFILPLAIMLLPGLVRAVRRNSAPVFDIPALLGKPEPAVKAALGPAFLDQADWRPSRGATAAENVLVWQSSDARFSLLVTYDNSTTRVTKFELVGLGPNSPSPAQLLEAGNLQQGDPHYSLSISVSTTRVGSSLVTVTPR